MGLFSKVAGMFFATDEKVKVSSQDTTASRLESKIVAGTNVTIAKQNAGANESIVVNAQGGVTGFTGSVNTASPNNLVNASRLLVDVPTTNGDLVIQPKGTGAIIANLPDGTIVGGNKRGFQVVDLQMGRNSPSQVAWAQYSVIIGGDRNTIGANAFHAITGGVSNNIPSTGQNAIALGMANTAGAQGTIVIGSNNTIDINSQWSVILGGNGSSPVNTITDSVSSVIIGSQNNVSSAQHALVTGHRATATRFGQYSRSVNQFAAQGDCQMEQMIVQRQTTDATPTELTCSGINPLNASYRISIATDTTYTFHGIVTARRTDVDGETAGWEIKGVIRNDAGTTAAVGTFTVTQLGANAGNTWTLAVTADNTNDALVLTGTGESGKTIRWGATITLMKVSG